CTSWPSSLYKEAPTGRALNLIRYLLFERLVPVATSDLEEALDLEPGEASKLRIRACMDAVRRAASSRRRGSFSPCNYLRAETSFTPLTSVADANRRYEPVVAVSDNTTFFKWFPSSLRKGTSLVVSANVKTLRDGDDLRQLDALRVSRVHVDPLNPVVRVSPGTMFGPFMEDDDEPSDGVNMSALGSTVGTLVAAFMDPIRGPLDGVSRTRPKYEKATTSKYDEALECLVSRTSKDGPSVVDKVEASQVMIDRLGVRIAYGAFEVMLSARSTEAKGSSLMAQLSELLGGVQRAFFAAYCFQFCEHEAPNADEQVTSGCFRCNAVLRDVEPFWMAFMCPVGSSMRPTNACAI
ncbi:hypothetical protein MRX96_052892, partial [Rhipicephalus microplus]